MPKQGDPSRPGVHTLDEEIQRYYELGQEQNRLLAQGGDLERVRTQDILSRYLPSPPAVICDVGGAAGIYAFPLSERGFRVHLIDPIALHIMQARTHAAKSEISLESIQSDREYGYIVRPASKSDRQRRLFYDCLFSPSG
jgi:2-polyprenyl-3-methyl-5-hydroxy-6-metoxy-1,4-benzoquinol methylase